MIAEETVEFLAAVLPEIRAIGFDDSGVAAQVGFWLAAHPWALLLPGLGVAAIELGFPLIFWLRARWQRIAFLTAVTTFHVMNYVLLNVQFLFMPVVLVTYLDLTWLARRIAPRLARPPGRRAAA